MGILDWLKRYRGDREWDGTGSWIVTLDLDWRPLSTELPYDYPNRTRIAAVDQDLSPDVGAKHLALRDRLIADAGNDMSCLGLTSRSRLISWCNTQLRTPPRDASARLVNDSTPAVFCGVMITLFKGFEAHGWRGIFANRCEEIAGDTSGSAASRKKAAEIVAVLQVMQSTVAVVADVLASADPDAQPLIESCIFAWDVDLCRSILTIIQDRILPMATAEVLVNAALRSKNEGRSTDTKKWASAALGADATDPRAYEIAKRLLTDMGSSA